MTQIVSFLSPKTAGASSVSLNAAILHKIVNPKQRVAFVEFAGWSSQASLFSSQDVPSWERIFRFYKTDEWNKTLLSRLALPLGADVFWSPMGKAWPVFNRTKATAFLGLLKNHYDCIVFDVAVSSPPDWQAFAHQQSDQIIGVLTPDPVSLKAWKNYVQAEIFPGKPHWLLNQVPSSEKKRLICKFSRADPQFLGVLRQDPHRFWRQCYENQPVSIQANRSFKKDLSTLLPQIFKV